MKSRRLLNSQNQFYYTENGPAFVPPPDKVSTPPTSQNNDLPRDTAEILIHRTLQRSEPQEANLIFTEQVETMTPGSEKIPPHLVMYESRSITYACQDTHLHIVWKRKTCRSMMIITLIIIMTMKYE